MKYIIYARKSAEAEDRQVISIPSQIEALKDIADEKDLKIVKIFREEKSATRPGRPVFNEMMGIIEEQKAEGILAWKLNRLARNPIDGGKKS